MREKTQLLIYDDDCGFCTQSALFLEQHADIELVPFSKVSDDELEFLESNWRDCAHLVTDDTVYSCGEAMERAFVDKPKTATVEAYTDACREVRLGLKYESISSGGQSSTSGSGGIPDGASAMWED